MLVVVNEESCGRQLTWGNRGPRGLIYVVVDAGDCLERSGVEAGELRYGSNVGVRQRFIEAANEGLRYLGRHLLLWAKDPKPVHQTQRRPLGDWHW